MFWSERGVTQLPQWEGKLVSHEGPGSCVFVCLSLLGFFIHSMAFFSSADRLSLHIQKGSPHTMYTRLPTQHILWARNGIRKKDYIFSICDWSATLKFWFQVPHLPPRNKLWHPAWARSLPCQIWYGRGKPMEKKLCVLRRAKHCVWVGCGTFSVSTCITRQINLCLGFPLLSIAFNDLFLLGTVF